MNALQFVAAAAFALVVVVSGPAVRAEEPNAFPTTPEQHLARAKTYREQAGKERRLAELHRFMIKSRQEQLGLTLPSSWWIEHCQKISAAAETVASEADALAGYHEKQAAELRRRPRNAGSR